MSSQSFREPGAVCQNTIGPAVLAVCAVKDPLSEPLPGPPLGRVGLGIAPQGGLVGKLKQIYVFHFYTRPFSLISGVRMCRVPARVPQCSLSDKLAFCAMSCAIHACGCALLALICVIEVVWAGSGPSVSSKAEVFKAWQTPSRALLIQESAR